MSISDAPDYLAYQYKTYVAQPTVLVANDATNKLTTALTLPVGILRKIRTFFPHGGKNHLYLQVYQGAVVPANLFFPGGAAVGSGQYIRESGLQNVFDVYREISAASVAFNLLTWNDNDVSVAVHFNHTIYVYFDVEVGGI
jgi:hypothetical protein